MILNCHSCGEANELLAPPGRRDECQHCGAELRCCLQCRLYDPSSTGCREPQAEVPRERHRANFCDYFTPISRPSQGPSPEEQAKKAFEELFRKKGL